MPIIIGKRLGPYEILSAVGAGGMGEVYRARDTKLGRDVAIKVLPEAFAYDSERLSRFEREAKMLASLNHPNIATIHGLELSNGTSYLVMELVSGETLQERIRRDGPVPVEEALSIAKQIAEALEAAHEKGIIHRDLKPANVKVTPEVKVKVLDFGLAKAFAEEPETSDPINSPTLSEAATMRGVILGTAAYMSPEQARGKLVDRRTDVWAFGCVLYELLCGHAAFEGEDVTEILAAVVKTEPDWNRFPEATPSTIRTLLHRCLRKDKRQRFHDAADIRIEIEDAIATPSLRPTVPSVGRGWRHAVVMGLAIVVAAAVASIAAWNLKPPPPPPRPVSRTVITLPPGQQLAGLNDGPAVAISPDGTRLAYTALQGGSQQLYLRAMDSLEAKPISNTEGAVNPFFSPDGQWVGFFSSDGKLKKVSVSGGAALALRDATNTIPRGASWGSQGTIAFGSTGNSLQQVSEAGGIPQPLIRVEEQGELINRWPEFLPGGKAVLFVAGTAGNFGNGQVAVQSLGTGERRNLISGATQPRYAHSGHLVYAQGGNLMAVPFDPQRLTAIGAAVPVVEGVRESIPSGAAQYSISDTGSLVYVSGGTGAPLSSLVWVDRKGTERLVATPARAYAEPRLSPDGQRIAVTTDGQVWIYDLSRETLTRSTFEGGFNAYPVWTPDGKRVAFQSNKEGQLNTFWQLADGSGGLERLTTSEYGQGPGSFSPDGQLLAFVEVNPITGYDIWVLRLGDLKAQPFLRTPFTEGGPRFSPDGRWLAYVSDESGRREIYVQPYPGPGGKWQISTEGGGEPVWNRNGRELFYRSGGKMMAVDVATQPSFTAGKPRVLFEGPYLPTPLTSANYDVSPDGQRFLMLKPNESTEAPTQISVVLNWFEELKQKIPTGKK